ncbi:MAG TPA: large conductance mechanosensitive channel protein MscL [Actinomycetota bacterium]|jgi:large conductance mechanosensitive channel|nr:large conductance mechanosensitive channel protein MscL [Actinomycetota bacterium]
MLKEFKAFLMKGNLVEIAVGLILALAFKTVVDSVVADIITPIIAAIFGQPDFSSLAIDIGDAKITYGNFLNVVFSFIVVGFVLFLVVKAYNRLRREEEATMKACPFCASDIPLDATRCPSCTSQLEGAAA